MNNCDPPKDRGLRLAVEHRAANAEKTVPATDFADRLMERIEQQRPKRKQHRAWYGAAIAAGGLLLLLMTHKENVKEETAARHPSAPIAAATNAPSGSSGAEKAHYKAAVTPLQGRRNTITRPPHKKKSARTAVPAAQELPDTLGDGIWRRRENVLLALQLLAECESAGEQCQRNVVVEAAFHAVPRPPELQLVMSETGDYQVVASGQQPSIIEL